MAMLHRIAAALLLVVGLAGGALAQSITAPNGVDAGQYFALVARVDSFDAAMKSSDMATVMSVIPPKVLDQIATKYNVTTAQLVEAAQQQIDAAMADIKLVSFGMDLENSDFYTLPDGTRYALIPTETVMDLGGGVGKMRASSTTLGVLDGPEWYLVRVEDPEQVAIFKEVYPAFADVTFPAGKMEPVTE
jgi:hypothetical protein